MSSIRFNRRAARRGVFNSHMERLEPRRLLSANVTVSVTDGELYVIGDSLNDSVVIDQAGLTATQLRVSPGDGLTTINGKPSASIFSGVNGIIINTGAGNDAVAIQNATVAAGVQITDPSGNQVFTLNTVTIGGNLSVTNGVGNNNLLIENSTITGNVTVNAGAVFNSQGWCSSSYNDTSAEEILTLTNSTVDNNVTITNISNDNQTNINGSIVLGNLTVTNNGNLSGDRDTQAGDIFTMNGSSIGGNVLLINAGGNATTTIDASTILGSLTVTNSGDSSCQSSDCDGQCGCTYSQCGGACESCTTASTNSSQSGDVFTLTASVVLGNVTVNNSGTYTSTDIGSSVIVGSLTVSNSLNSSSQVGNCYGSWSQCTYSFGACGSGGGKCSYSSGQCGSSCQSGASSASSDNVFALSASAVEGNVAITNPNGTASITSNGSAIIGNTTIVTGNGTSSLEMVDNSSFLGNLNFTAGNGTVSVDITAGSAIFGNATFNVPRQAMLTITPSQVGGVLTL